MGLEIINGGDMPPALNEGWPEFNDGLGQGDDHLRAIKTVLKNFYSGLVGTPLPRLVDTPLEAHFLEFDGSAIDANTDPILFAMYGENIPDLRGRSMAGWKEGETVGTPIGSQNLIHSHGVTVNSRDLGSKNSTAKDFGSAVSTAGGTHTHQGQENRVSAAYGPSYPYYTVGQVTERLQSQWSDWTWRNWDPNVVRLLDAGNHNHTVPLGVHTVNTVIGSHDHSVGEADEGGEEVRVESVIARWVCFRG